MTDAVVVAIIGFIAAILGGLTQSVFQRWLAVEQFRREIKRPLYDQFFDDLWRANAASQKPLDRNEASLKFQQSCTKIGLYGSAEVVRALGDAMTVMKFDDPKDRLKLERLYRAMRHDLGNRDHEKLPADKILFSKLEGPKP